jgi:hypothetical protein
MPTETCAGALTAATSTNIPNNPTIFRYRMISPYFPPENQLLN